jgi:hypothetical protein
VKASRILCAMLAFAVLVSEARNAAPIAPPHRGTVTQQRPQLLLRTQTRTHVTRQANRPPRSIHAAAGAPGVHGLQSAPPGTPAGSKLVGTHAQGLGHLGGPPSSRMIHGATIQGTQLHRK